MYTNDYGHILPFKKWPVDPNPMPRILPRDEVKDDERPVSKDEVQSIFLKKEKLLMANFRKFLNKGLRVGTMTFDISSLNSSQLSQIVREYRMAGWEVKLINNDKRLEFS